MNKEQRKRIAAETVEILNRGHYTSPIHQHPCQVPIKPSTYYPPERAWRAESIRQAAHAGSPLQRLEDIPSQLPPLKPRDLDTLVEVKDETVLELCGEFLVPFLGEWEGELSLFEEAHLKLTLAERSVRDRSWFSHGTPRCARYAAPPPMALNTQAWMAKMGSP